MTNIPSTTKIQFSHANGFPARSYQYLFSLIENQAIHFIDIMGHIGHPKKYNLEFLKDELIASLEKEHSEPVIGLGHSSGAATTILAAASRPDLFKHIILLDPVIFGVKKRLLISMTQKLGLWEIFGPAKKAKRRRNQFSSRAEAFEYFSKKNLFKNFHAKCFESYIEHGLTESRQGFELSFRPQVEADIFRNVPTKVPKGLADIKGTIIYGKESDVFHPSDIKWWSKNYPNFKLIEFDGGHLFPFEAPDETAELLNRILLSLNGG